jgi:hypothetical protein
MLVCAVHIALCILILTLRTGWRVSKYENDKGVKSQPATQIVTENPWFSKTFDSYVNNLNALPYDHHELIGMVAPRGYIGFENTDFVWLSPLGAYACEKAAHNIFTALGVPDNHGYAQVGGHDHCAWPSSLTPVLNVFIDKFLNGKSTDTSNKVTTNNQFQGLTYAESDWINWTTPILSGSSGGGTTTDVSTTTSSATSTSTTVVPTATTTTSTTYANALSMTLHIRLTMSTVHLRQPHQVLLSTLNVEARAGRERQLASLHSPAK